MSNTQRFRGVLAGAVVSMLVLSGCAASYTTEQVTSCANYSITHPSLGRVSVQQAGRGKSIQWGIYLNPGYKTAKWSLKIYAGGVHIDSKNQSYEPHGSVNAQRALKYSGQQLRIKGTATQGKDVLTLDLKCTIR